MTFNERSYVTVACDGCNGLDAYDDLDVDGIPVFDDQEQARDTLAPRGWTFTAEGKAYCPGCSSCPACDGRDAYHVCNVPVAARFEREGQAPA